MVTNMNATVIALICLGLVATGGVSYFVGQSPVPILQAEMQTIKDDRAQVQTQLTNLQNDNEELLSQMQKISANLTLQTSAITQLVENCRLIQVNYDVTQKKYSTLLSEYYTLLLKYQGVSAPPEAGMVITKVSGIENSGFDGTGGPWVMQGKGGKSPYAALWQYPSFSSYVTQTVQLSSDIDGLVFDVKPEPVGASITLQLRIGETIIFSKEYSGSSTLYTWKQEVIELVPLFTMREQYGFNSTDTYEIRFSVLSGPDNSARVLIDNVSLVKIEYTPP